MKYFRMNLTNYGKDLYAENCKTLQRKIKDLNKWKAKLYY